MTTPRFALYDTITGRDVREFATLSQAYAEMDRLKQRYGQLRYTVRRAALHRTQVETANNAFLRPPELFQAAEAAAAPEPPDEPLRQTPDAARHQAAGIGWPAPGQGKDAAEQSSEPALRLRPPIGASSLSVTARQLTRLEQPSAGDTQQDPDEKIEFPVAQGPVAARRYAAGGVSAPAGFTSTHQPVRTEAAPVALPEAAARTGRRVAWRAWLMLGAAFTAVTVSAALMHSYPVYLLALIREFGWSRAQISIAYSVSQLVAGASAPFVGALVDRLGPLRLLLMGSGLLVLGLAASAYLSALWQIIGLYGIVMTVGANCLGLVVFVPLLSRHFVQRRGMAISIVQSANGIARGISAPLVQLSISLIGWRTTYLVQAAIMAAVALPLAGLFRRTDPSPQHADAARTTVSGLARDVATRAGWTLAEAIRTPHFWLLSAVYLFTGLGSFFVLLHQLAFAADVGFDRLYAAEVLGIGALLAVPGIVATGTLSDYVGRELSAIMTYGLSIVGVICALLITRADQQLLLWLHACFFGLTWGARGPAITAKTADLFPGPQLGRIVGVITIGQGLGAALGSWGAGWIYDLSGSYRLAFTLSIAAYVVAGLGFWALRRQPARRALVSELPDHDANGRRARRLGFAQTV